MSDTRVRYNYFRYEPMEALIRLYDDGASLQEMVNTFLDSDVEGYGRERIRNLILTYRRLVAAGEYENPTDLELDEADDEYPDAVYENAKVPVDYMRVNVMEAIIRWYEDGISVATMLENIRDCEITSYSKTRIQNLIKIYKQLKKDGSYERPIDVELQEGSSGIEKEKKNKTVKSSLKKKCSKNSRESDCEEDDCEVDEDDSLISKRSVKSNVGNVADDPLPVFTELNNHVMMVAEHLTPALLITGPGGIGKSYSVQSVLSQFGKEKKDFVIMKGKCTASAMFSFLFRHYDKICVFDDCDSVLCDKEGIAVLKGALDSGRDRSISWNTRGADMVDTFDCDTRKEVLDRLEKWSKRHGGKKGIPTHFQFNGSVIFISNMTRKEIKSKDSALLTRCSVVDIEVTNEEILERLGSLLPKFQIFDARGKSIVNKKLMREVYDWINSKEFLNHPKMKGKNVDFRLFIKAYKARYAKIAKWKEMAFSN